MHRDDVAAQYGFPGGLVPGVGLFAYLTQPVVAQWGRDWLTRGAIAARFLKPVLDGERVTVHARRQDTTHPVLALELRSAQGLVCAIATAELPSQAAELSSQAPSHPLLANYSRHELPLPGSLLPARIESLGSLPRPLGSLEFPARWQSPVEGPEPFVAALCDPSPIYRGDNAACHPALVVAYANYLLMQNFDLGPWLHVASRVQYFALPREGEPVALRGRIVAAYVKRGHEFVEADLALFDAAERPLAQILHTAIIQPARVAKAT
jgi:hypothetical protein